MAVSPTRKPPYHKDHLSPRCKYSEYNSDDNDDDDDDDEDDDDDDDDDDDSDDDDGDARACRPRGILLHRIRALGARQSIASAPRGVVRSLECSKTIGF